MARGAEAKENFINKIISVPNIEYIGEYDKKHYFWSEENGEKIQIAIAMTCPKNPVAVIDNNMDGDLDFENMDNAEVRPTTFEPAEITQEEKDKVAELIEKLGL